MTVAEHHRVSRQAGEWAAHYRVDARADWRGTRVIDVSLEGAALELYDTTRDDLVRGPVHLQIRSVTGDEVAANVRAVLRNHVRLENGRVIALLGLPFLHRDERSLLHQLVSPRTLA